MHLWGILKCSCAGGRINQEGYSSWKKRSSLILKINWRIAVWGDIVEKANSMPKMWDY